MLRLPCLRYRYLPLLLAATARFIILTLFFFFHQESLLFGRRLRAGPLVDPPDCSLGCRGDFFSLLGQALLLLSDKPLLPLYLKLQLQELKLRGLIGLGLQVLVLCRRVVLGSLVLGHLGEEGAAIGPSIDLLLLHGHMGDQIVLIVNL
jgi:hypothetical protein